MCICNGKKIIEFPKTKDFTFIRDLGQGGTGKTVLLKDETIDENFVCKKYSTFYPEQQSLYYKNFVDEIKILYKINHPNIVRVFNYYLYPKDLTGYIFMEYINGVNVEEYTKVAPLEINNLFIQTINGFKYLEEKSILHRDIRPDNILVSNEGIVKIIDFGFGKTIESTKDCNKSISLNWPYSLPNDFDMSTYDFKTEIYFIGKLFEDLITTNNLSQSFKYKSIINLMIVPTHEERIQSFYNISRKIASEDSLRIDFNSTEKKIYRDIADSLMGTCISVKSYTKYNEDIELITKSLNELLQKSILEECIQSNRLFIGCFINPPYICKTKKSIPVIYLSSFVDWWEKLPNARKIIVLNNLWTRFDTIIRKDQDDLPF